MINRWIVIIISAFLSILPVRSASVSPARAVAFVANGFVIAASVVDPGSGYRSAPTVTFQGGGGSGAKAHSQISAQGSVTNIVMENAGIGYSATPAVVIPPPETLDIESISLVPLLVVTNAVGLNVDIQISDRIDGTNWVTLTNIFVTTNRYLFVDLSAPETSKRFYRAQRSAGPAVNPNPEMLVLIPAGSFLMGSPESESGSLPSERPQTAVTITEPFYMAKYEVTAGLYSSITNLSSIQTQLKPTQAIVNVSWIEATNFCAKYTESERAAGRLPGGYVYRLPTEAEWEYACRAGTTTAYSFGNDPALFPQYGWVGDSQATIHPVGEKAPNPWGLFDMHGNAWEWCFDAVGPYSGGSVSNPTGPASGSGKIVRGGCTPETPQHSRSASRGYVPEDTHVLSGFYVLGFRMVLGRPIP